MPENTTDWLRNNAGLLVSIAAALAIVKRWGMGVARWSVSAIREIYGFPAYMARIEHAGSIARANSEILLNRLSVATWESDPAGGLVWINRTFTELTGWTIDDLRGNDWRRVVHPDDLKLVEEASEKMLANRTVFELEYRWRTRWGTDIRGRATARWQKNGHDYISGAFEPVANEMSDLRDEIADLRGEQKSLTRRVTELGTSMTEWMRAAKDDSSAAHTHLLAEIEALRGDFERMKNRKPTERRQDD